MVNIQYRQYRAPVTSDVSTLLSIEPTTDNGIELQTCDINVNGDVLNILWDDIDIGGSIVRRRVCYINGVATGYLSNNCGITIKSRTATIQALTNSLVDLPTDMKIVAELINPTTDQYVANSETAVLVYSASNGGVEDFQTIIDNATAGSNMYLADGALITPRDADFAPVVRILANTSFPRYFVYQFHNTVTPLGTIGTFDYSVTSSGSSTTIGGINFTYSLIEEDNIDSTTSEKYFTDNFYYNIFENIDVWFYSIDGDDYHCFTEDVAGELLTLGDVLTSGARNNNLKTFSIKNAKNLRERKNVHKFYPAALLK